MITPYVYPPSTSHSPLWGANSILALCEAHVFKHLGPRAHVHHHVQLRRLMHLQTFEEGDKASARVAKILRLCCSGPGNISHLCSKTGFSQSHFLVLFGIAFLRIVIGDFPNTPMARCGPVSATKHVGDPHYLIHLLHLLITRWV
jgi:hypothetical protein